MSRIVSVLFLLFFVLFFQSATLLSREIVYLPATLTGDLPPELGPKLDASWEFAKLSRFYLKKNYFVEVQDVKLLEGFWSELDTREGTSLKQEDLNRTCLESEANFIVQDEIDFGKPVFIQTNLYNCKNKSKQIVQSKLISNPILALERHVEKSFRFLPPKSKDRKNEKNSVHEVIYFFDVNSSYAYYRKDFIASINSLLDATGLYLGLVMVKKDKVIIHPPSLDHKDIRRSLVEVGWQGSNQTDSILSALLSLKTRISSGSKQSRKLFLLLSAVPKERSSSIVLALQELRQLGLDVVFLIPNHSNLDSIRELQRMAKNANVRSIGITESQKIGTPEGYDTLYLNQLQLYTNKENPSPPFDFSLSSFKRFEPSLVRAAVDVVSPYNMHIAYEKITEKRVIEKEEVKTDIQTILGLETTSTRDESNRFKSVLFQTKGEALWLTVPNELPLMEGKEYILQSTWVLDPLTSYGIKNVPNETYFLRTSVSYPKFLTIKASLLKKYLDANQFQELSGFMVGTVGTIKKR